VLRAKDNEI